MIKILLVGSGGFIGSALRYLIGSGVQRWFSEHRMPYGTMAVNILGCLVIGFLGGLTESRAWFTQEIRLFFFLGILGGFTTFSSFGYETVNLVRSGLGLHGFSNIVLHIVLGLGAVWTGLTLAGLTSPSATAR